MKLQKVSIVVPTYREGENIEPLAQRIVAAMEGKGYEYEIFIVDDNSEDGTVEAVQRLAGQGIAIRIHVRKNERGLSSAVLEGFRRSEGEILVCMDGDLSHPPEALPELIRCAAEGKAEFVIGSRYVKGGTTEEGWGLLRKLNSWAATVMARPFTKARDPMAGYFAMRREVFERGKKLDPVGFKIGLELIVKCGCKKVCEVPIHFQKRLYGSSKLSLNEQINYVKHLVRLWKYQIFG